MALCVLGHTEPSTVLSLSMEQILALVLGRAGDAHSEAGVGGGVLLAEDDGGVDLAVPQAGQLLHGLGGELVGGGGDGQGDENLVGVEAGVPAP